MKLRTKITLNHLRKRAVHVKLSIVHVGLPQLSLLNMDHISTVICWISMSCPVNAHQELGAGHGSDFWGEDAWRILDSRDFILSSVTFKKKTKCAWIVCDEIKSICTCRAAILSSKQTDKTFRANSQIFYLTISHMGMCIYRVTLQSFICFHINVACVSELMHIFTNCFKTVLHWNLCAAFCCMLRWKKKSKALWHISLWTAAQGRSAPFKQAVHSLLSHPASKPTS